MHNNKMAFGIYSLNTPSVPPEVPAYSTPAPLAIIMLPAHRPHLKPCSRPHHKTSLTHTLVSAKVAKQLVTQSISARSTNWSLPPSLELPHTHQLGPPWLLIIASGTPRLMLPPLCLRHHHHWVLTVVPLIMSPPTSTISTSMLPTMV